MLLTRHLQLSEIERESKLRVKIVTNIYSFESVDYFICLE